ncbi:histone-like nucleoid-structuring protein, MvaT/MvaU family [Pseudomonas coleopterorum]|uniref:histone-like nucleoid-structuring protein, MvaT/MvaU family n=1 Tax=Pseudomonas coleopterorum TaxID=1605838 RepID=UPI00089D5838|nr:histone-like nucleoid-structuring protein, MvaT/MvaU family [Pseudomonas coleopterorum]SEE73377.1 hypothetical protein SAMN05216510_4090 [Pseudomonas coleopterorum]
MSKLAEFRRLERDLAEQLHALEAMKDNEGLKKEIEFEGKLRDLLGEYSKSLRDVVAIMDPQAELGQLSETQSKKTTRKSRALKVYRNPHTGETVETKGGNHKTLKAWKAEHGGDTVESWLS